MDCERFREAISARLDGEDEPISPARVDAHLARCAPCRQWQRDAAAVTRLARLRPVPAGMPSTGMLLAGFRPRRGRLAVALRIILCAVGAAQVALGVVQIAGAHAGGAAHLAHELAAWNVAVGCGFLWIAVPGRRRDVDGRRASSIGALPMLTAFMVVLAAGETYDLVTGTVGVAGLLSHGAAFTGYLIVVTLARVHRTAPLPVPQPV